MINKVILFDSYLCRTPYKNSDINLIIHIQTMSGNLKKLDDSFSKEFYEFSFNLFDRVCHLLEIKS